MTETFISAVDRKDVDTAKKLMVSPEQVARVIECAPNTESSWHTPAGRAERVAKRLKTYADHDPSSGRVRLGTLWEEYDNPAQWHAYKPGDDLGNGCHAKAAFDEQNYRIELLIDLLGRSKVSTKPIELWRIDGSWYVWDDPLDTEGW